MNRVYLLIGGNMGDRVEYLHRTISIIEEECGDVVARSAIYETAAWGMTDQPSFLNQAICLITEIAPERLMSKLLHIETRLGRVRNIKMGPRTVDIDILFVEDQAFRTSILVSPHPRIQDRRFALTPLAEIAGNIMPPTFHKTVYELLQECTDPLPVTQLAEHSTEHS